MTNDFLPIILECIEKLLSFRTTLLLTLAIALGLAIGCWIMCNYWTRLWNTHYQITKTHHLFCALAATITFGSVILYQSLDYVLPITKLMVKNWELGLENDGNWSQKTFINAYEAVKELAKEDFSNYPHPNEGGNTIPVQHDETRNKVAVIYATAAVTNFKKNYSYLSKILWANSEPSKQAISQDHQAFFVKNPGKSYPVAKAINLAARLISDELFLQTPRVVFLSRLILVILFFFIQAIPFSLIGWAAYKDLKVTV